MSESNGGVTGSFRKRLVSLTFGATMLLVPTSGVDAGAIKHATVHTKATVEIQKANPWSGYWSYALKHHLLKLTGPAVHTKLALSADGTLPISPFVQYMQWREGLNAKRFDSFHPTLAQMLKKAKTPSSGTPPESLIPPSGGTPILPPDFTPVTVPETIIPPQVPEPSTGVLAVGMIGIAWAVRRRIRLRA